MVLLFLTNFPFSNAFPLQAFAAVNKYPNPLAPHVVSMDVVSREIMPDGTVRSERIIGIQQDAPKWITRLLGTADTTFVREVSFLVPSGLSPPPVFKPKSSQGIPADDSLDWQQPPKLVLASTNLTLSSYMQCRESITYLPHPWSTGPSAPPASPTTHADAPDPAHHPPSPPLPGETMFTQSALIFTTGSVASSAWPPFGINEDSPVAAETNPPARSGIQRAAGSRIEQWAKDRFEMNADKGRDAMKWAGVRWAKVWNQREDGAKPGAAVAKENGGPSERRI